MSMLYVPFVTPALIQVLFSVSTLSVFDMVWEMARWQNIRQDPISRRKAIFFIKEILKVKLFIQHYLTRSPDLIIEYLDGVQSVVQPADIHGNICLTTRIAEGLPHNSLSVEHPHLIDSRKTYSHHSGTGVGRHRNDGAIGETER